MKFGIHIGHMGGPLAELVAALPATVPLAIEAPNHATADLSAVDRATRAYRALAALTGA